MLEDGDLHEPEVVLHEPEVVLHEPEVVLHEPEVLLHEPEVALDPVEALVHLDEASVHLLEAVGHLRAKAPEGLPEDRELRVHGLDDHGKPARLFGRSLRWTLLSCSHDPLHLCPRAWRAATGATRGH